MAFPDDWILGMHEYTVTGYRCDWQDLKSAGLR